jgi:DNA-binding XRE family transcriptional regulator
MDQAPEKKTSQLQVGEPSTTEHLDWNLIGRRIKTQREYRDLTQKQLADKIGTTKQTISNYESGKCKMTRSEALPNI